MSEEVLHLCVAGSHLREVSDDTNADSALVYHSSLTLYVILNFLLVTSKKEWKETGETTFNNIFHLTQHTQNIVISKCSKIVNEIVYILFYAVFEI